MTSRQTQVATLAALTITAGAFGIYSSRSEDAGARDQLRDRGCDITISSPELEPRGRAKLSAGQSTSVTFSGKARRCPSATVTIFSKVGEAAETELGTAQTSATGAWSYGPVALDDNATTVISAQMTTTAGKVSRATATLDVAAARPRVVLTTPAPNGSGRAFVVASAADGGCGSGGNGRAEHREPGYYHDLGCAAGGQVSPVLTVYGASPGTLTATYGVTPLASVSVTTDPQTFTAAELGAWTLDDWTRDDLVIRAAKDGDAGVAETVVDLQVSTGVPPQLIGPNGLEGVQTTILNARHADVDVAWVLPATPAPVARPTIEIFHTNSTKRSFGPTGTELLPAVARGVYTVTTSPTLIADPAATGRSGVQVITIADAGQPVYCAPNAPSLAPDGGVLITQTGGSAVIGDYNCDSSAWPTPTPVYCVTAAGTSKITATEVGRCVEATHDWLSNPANATHIVACWGDGTEVADDAGTEVQLWRCHDGRQYRGGETYVEHLTWLPPLNTYFFHVEVRW